MGDQGQRRTIARGRASGRAAQPPVAQAPAIPRQGQPPLFVREVRPGDHPEERPPQPQAVGRAAPGSRGLGRAVAAPGVEVPVQGMAALALDRQEIVIVEAGGAGGGGDNTLGLGRGALRGRRIIIPELLHTRPDNLVSKHGSEGQPLKLHANYFRMKTTPDWCLFKYDVAFAPEEDRTHVRKGLLRLHKDKLGGYIFDGTTLYTSNRLQAPLELYSNRQSDDVNIKLTVRLVGDMVKGDENYLQFFNIIMRKCLEYLQLQLVGRNFFDARNKVEVREYKLELWPGYETSIRQHERDILMCTEIRHKVMRQQTVFDILDECYSRNRAGYQAQFSAMVIGMTVLTDYNNNTYRIDDVKFDVRPSSTFDCKGVPTTYLDYYRQKYQITIRDPKQPLLLSKTKARERRAGLTEFVYLVPELCRATGLTDDMRSNPKMMRDLANYTRLNPGGRIERLLSFQQRLSRTEAVRTEMTQWNMEIDSQLLSVPGRALPAEDIIFAGNAKVSAGPEADWTKHVRARRMLVAPELADWVVIVPKNNAREVQDWVGLLKSCVSSMGFSICNPRPHVINDDRAVAYTAAIEDIMSRANPQLIMCIVTNNRADRYSAIKKKSCIDRPVPTQCVMLRNLGGKNPQSVATKIAVQINCKIGGAPWGINLPVTGLMVAGFDVCHDTNTKGCDYGALVASLDKGFSRYFSAVSAHRNGEELSNELATNMCKALHKYKELNESLPSRIVVYRDGVGEGQIPYVYEHEVENLKIKLGALYADPSQLKMAYIIVTKRLNTRLFLGSNNPPAGTIVDDVITNPNRYDFFVVSQAIRNGSVSPTGYSVISDNVNLDAGKIQKLTFKLTHMYFNWSGTVRVPAPCQFAHKLAFLVSQSIHASPSNHLETLLYFL